MKISVLMPVYNEEKYIRQAIESLAKQSGDFELEVVVVDDFSDDHTRPILKELSVIHDFLKVFKNQTKGKNNAFNLAFKESTGDLIALFAGDDLLPPSSLDIRSKPLRDKLNTMTATVCKLKTISAIKKFDGVITPRSPEKGSFSGGAMMMTRKMADYCFPLPPLLGNEDMWLVCHMEYLEEMKLIHVPEVGILYRIHENNSSTRTASFEKKTESMHNRFIVYSLFLEHYRSKLSEEAIIKLSALAAAETLRYQSNIMSLFLMDGLALREKIRFIMHASKLLYWVRIQLFSFFSGR